MIDTDGDGQSLRCVSINDLTEGASNSLFHLGKFLLIVGDNFN